MTHTTGLIQSGKVTGVSVNDGLITVTTSTGAVIETGRDNTATGGALECSCGVTFAAGELATMAQHVAFWCPRLHGGDEADTAYECDGCHTVATASEIRAAFPATPAMLAIDPDALGLHDCTGHMGWMEVAGVAWTAYYTQGTHPMTAVTDQVAQLYARYVLDANGLGNL